MIELGAGVRPVNAMREQCVAGGQAYPCAL